MNKEAKTPGIATKNNRKARNKCSKAGERKESFHKQIGAVQARIEAGASNLFHLLPVGAKEGSRKGSRKGCIRKKHEERKVSKKGDKQEGPRTDTNVPLGCIHH